LLLSALVLGWSCAAALLSPQAASEPPKAAEAHIANAMKIKLKIVDREMMATLVDSETSRDFVSLLPLTLTLNDLFGREKFGHLPRAISDVGKRVRTYEVGEVVYWSPGPDVAIFYHHDGQSIPSPGIIVIGKIDFGIEALSVPGSATVTIERVENQ
jgi:hypothetical protein